MRIGLSTRTFSANTYVEHRDGLAQDWASFLEKLGYVPIFIPNTLLKIDEFLSDLSLDMIILTGGGDCPTQLTIATNDLQNKRNLTEKALLEYSVANKTPLLGVCRGFQFINAYFGGTVTRSLKDIEQISGNHVATEHKVFFVVHDWLSLNRASQMQVNSFHDDGILDSQLASCLDITAVSDEERCLVEGFRHKSLPISGIQWHPERSDTSLEFDRLLIKKIIRRA
jgi:N5-(cytidine 5'-diphosphoramidyl)-L-glutamine hydrolase